MRREVAAEVVGVRIRIAGLLLAGFVLWGCFAQRPSWRPPPPMVPAGRSMTGIASWYGPGFNGRRTSSGVIYNEDGLSAASTRFPLGTQLLVTNLSNGRSVQVLVNDHGPYVSGRDLDLSHRAALILGIVKPGTAMVRMEVVNTPPGGPPLGPRYFVQVGSFADRANASRVGERLERYYDDVHIVEATFTTGRYYRVQMGMFTDRVSAEQRAHTVSLIGMRPVIIAQ
jgi:rare lipoprotein A